MPTDSTQQPKVAVGPTTVTGYSVGGAGFLLALIAFLSGDSSAPTVEAIAAGAIAGLSYLVTQIGRYIQARELARKPSVVILSSECPLAPGVPGNANASTRAESVSALVERLLAEAKAR